jgi:serine phosphatase RsbU (regulator of sigma subunit)
VAPGETLLLYTDGLVERRGELLDVGLGRLVDAASSQGGDLDDFVDSLLGRLAGPGSQDDIAVLALRRHGPDRQAAAVGAGRPGSGPDPVDPPE